MSRLLQRLWPWTACRFCQQWLRRAEAKDAQRYGGACRACRADTLAWLAEIGCCVTAPRELGGL